MDRPAIADVLYDVSDADLIERWQEAKPEAERARRVLLALEGELIRRMGDRLALETEGGTVTRSPQLGPYQWDKEAIRRLFGDRLSAGQWDEIFVDTIETKTRTVAVTKYAKQLGITEAELAGCYFRAERKQELEWHPLEGER